MNTYQALAKSVIINKNNRLMGYDDSLTLVGTGRSAFVFRIKSSNKAIKIFFPAFSHIAKEEADIYRTLQNIEYYPSVYEAGLNYIVMDYIEGLTLFDCLTKGHSITSTDLNEIDYALSLASKRGLNPSDIHLRNIIITAMGKIKIIDVARFRQKKECHQWADLQKAYRNFYRKKLFPKKCPALLLNSIAYLYKKGWIPNYRT